MTPSYIDTLEEDNPKGAALLKSVKVDHIEKINFSNFNTQYCRPYIRFAWCRRASSDRFLVMHGLGYLAV